MMKSHLILRLHRIILIAALFLAASCKEDDTSVQLKAPQTLTAIPSETSLLIEWVLRQYHLLCFSGCDRII